MTSSKLGQRRRSAGTPPICHSKPPIDVPLPIPPWPPNAFDIHLVGQFIEYGVIIYVDEHYHLERIPFSDVWEHPYLGVPPYKRATWAVRFLPENADLEFWGYASMTWWTIAHYYLPIVNPGPATYVVSTWHLQNPWPFIATAYFKF